MIVVIVVDDAGEEQEVAWVTDHSALAMMLTHLHEEGQLTENDRIGLLLREEEGDPGTWLISPTTTRGSA